MAKTQDERTITDAALGRKVELFLRAHHGQWFSSGEISAGTQLRKQTLLPMLERLLDAGTIQFATGQMARALGRNERAKLYSAERAGTVAEPD